MGGSCGVPSLKIQCLLPGLPTNPCTQDSRLNSTPVLIQVTQKLIKLLVCAKQQDYLSAARRDPDPPFLET